MKLLGKELSEWGHCPDWSFEKDKMWFTNIARNGDVYIARYRDGDYYGAIDSIVRNGNEFRETSEIIRRVNAVVHLGIFTEAEWKRLIPIVEYALAFNIEYVKCLHDVEPYFKAMYEKYGPLAAHTIMERMHLEFCQGLFAFDRYRDSEDMRRPCYT